MGLLRRRKTRVYRKRNQRQWDSMNQDVRNAGGKFRGPWSEPKPRWSWPARLFLIGFIAIMIGMLIYYIPQDYHILLDFIHGH